MQYLYHTAIMMFMACRESEHNTLDRNKASLAAN
jgi:hypothetical protein